MTDEDYKNLAILADKGRKALLEMDRDTALAIFQDVVDIDDTYIDGWTGMAQVYYELGKLDKAELSLKKSLNLIKDKYGPLWKDKKISWNSDENKPVLRSLLMLAVMYYRKGDIDKAKEYLNILINMDSDWDAPKSILDDIDKETKFDKLKYQNINI